MTAYLYTASNPHAPLRDNGMRGWYYIRRQGGLDAITAIAVHTAETDPTPRSAEAVAKWQRDQAEQPSSYHVICDSDSTVRLLPDEAVAFHIRGFNTPSLGLSFATRAAWWGNWPAWDDLALRQAAAQARQWADTYDIPLRWLRKTEAEAGQRGFVRHSVMDPDRRTDPGLGFPSEKFLELIEGDDMPTPEEVAKAVWTFPLPHARVDSKTAAWQYFRIILRRQTSALANLTELVEAIDRGDTVEARQIAQAVREELAGALND